MFLRLEKYFIYFLFSVIFLFSAFWDATRAFMLLAVLSCFAGIVLGLSAFTNGTKNRRVRTGGIALVLSGTNLTLTAAKVITAKTKRKAA